MDQVTGNYIGCSVQGKWRLLLYSPYLMAAGQNVTAERPCHAGKSGM